MSSHTREVVGDQKAVVVAEELTTVRVTINGPSNPRHPN
jgi:hypothetical protein